MVRKRFAFGAAFVALLVLFWVTGGVVAGPPSEEPGGDVSIAATVSSKFSYQGVLRENDSPVTGSRHMTFRLYSDDTCTTQVGSDIVRSGLQVSEGLFSVDLDVNHDDFNGQGLWLEVEVGGTKIGCQEILPVPYALGLRPGARIWGEVTGAWAVYAFNEASTGESHGVLARSQSPDGCGVKGEHYAGGCGVQGLSSTRGVYGEAYVSSGVTYGVYGKSASSSGYGVYGYATNTGGGHGVYAKSKGPGLGGAALYAEADHASGIAILGWNDSTDSTLVLTNHGTGHLIKAFGYGPFSNPGLRFKVENDGDVHADGTYDSPASDFAEMLPAVAGLEPGDVLVIGLDGLLVRSTEAYASAVVGVYSTKPAFLGGGGINGDNEGKVPLALVGVVPVKASAENGPIKPGDLLTTSSTPGHAMRAGHFVGGAIIGKALEGLSEGTGVIKMLVMLQ